MARILVPTRKKSKISGRAIRTTATTTTANGGRTWYRRRIALIVVAVWICALSFWKFPNNTGTTSGGGQSWDFAFNINLSLSSTTLPVAEESTTLPTAKSQEDIPSSSISGAGANGATDTTTRENAEARQQVMETSTKEQAAADTAPTTISAKGDEHSWRGFKNRTIAFVHVGKAGGITIRGSTSLACSSKDKEKCVNQRFAPTNVLSRQVRYVFHMHEMKQEEVEQTTSFLFNLRNPVERVISTYRYSHPANCNEEMQSMRVNKPYGCDLVPMTHNASHYPHYQVYPMFNTCFPLPSMEAFAESLLKPFPPLDYYNRLHLHRPQRHHEEERQKGVMREPMLPQQEWQCRGMAYQAVRGKGVYIKSFPHMYYNYGHYLGRTIQQYPDKEVFAVRTEHEWDDLKDLDVALGGDGHFKKEGHAESHGSEWYAPSTLKPEAYQKLCCVLEEDMVHYQEILYRAVNLNTTTKEACMEDIRQKCGFVDWTTWRQECQARLRKNAKVRSEALMQHSGRKNFRVRHDTTA